jgi:hypothetical protein
MQRFEYKIVPAPRRGEKARGVKTSEERFALALNLLMNRLGAEGWDYVRADALPCDERAGLTGGVKTTYQNMLVFRRVLSAEASLTLADGPTVPAPLVADPDPMAAMPPLRLGAAESPMGHAPALGPAKPDLAAE